MNHFLLITSGLDVLPLLYAITRMPQLWDQHTLRTTHPGTPHTEVSDIWCRFNDLGEYEATGDIAAVADQHESIPYPAWWLLPELRPLVFGLMTRVQATRLGRVLITKLRPGCRIAPHADSKPHSVYYQRHHITLTSPPECLFRVEDEVLNLAPGTCWYVNNALEHEVINHGDSDRLTLIVDTHGDPLPAAGGAP
jgi:quercetin dioxygenase-like cupin family protein